jgi:hypothetical protein
VGEGRQLSLCRITVTGPGMADMVHEEDISGKSSIRVTIDVPSGLNRSFLIQMFIENNDTVIIQAKSEGHNLEGVHVEIPMEPKEQDDYFEPPVFSGILSVSNSETRSVMLNWKPATDNITDQKGIQYLIYLTTQAERNQNANDIFKAYELGTGTIRDEDPLMSYTYEGEKLILLSYEYEGALPTDDNRLDEVTSSGRLKTGVPYLFIVRASDEWGFNEDNLVESEQITVYMLDVEVQGSGTITSEPKGINCGSKCSEDFLSKNVVTLTAEAGAGAEFEGWTENDQCAGTSDCELTLSNNELITAKFCQKTTYYLDADGDGYGGSETYIDSCTEPDQDNYVANNDDCDDSKPEINPSAIDFCNNDIDENCDGTDEKDCDCNEGETRPCGIDTGECEIGLESCTVNLVWSGICDGDIGPSQELCDGLDNDCNGQIDEPFADLGTSCSAGFGACEAIGIMVCDAAKTATICDATPGTPSTEECDGIDNDCNGEIDDGIAEEPSTCGEGACESSGVKQCINGQPVDSCTPGDPSPEICDGEDNDCDGKVDETFTDLGDSCSEGKGECKDTGKIVCNSSGTGTTCNASAGSPKKEICDGKDNDCDGVPDGSENLTQQCGDTNVGECSYGTEICNDSGKWINCDAVYPSDEICTDNKDNDCDGKTDYDDTDDCIEEPCGGCPDNEICINGQCEPKTQENSCEARGDCCLGRDDTCTAPGGATCFCDEACIEFGDCCADYPSGCPDN